MSKKSPHLRHIQGCRWDPSWEYLQNRKCNTHLLILKYWYLFSHVDMFDTQKFVVVFFPLKFGLLKCQEPTWNPHGLRCLVLANSFQRMVCASVTLVGLFLRWLASEPGLISTCPKKEGKADKAIHSDFFCRPCWQSQVIFSRLPGGQGSPPLARKALSNLCCMV